MGFQQGHKNYNKKLEVTCQACNQALTTSSQNFSIHLNKKHSLKLWEYKLKYELNGQWPLCKCGCMQKAPVHYHETKFSDYIHGHNNTGFTIEECKKGAITRNEFTKKNGLTPAHRDAISKGVVKNYQENGGPWQRGTFYSTKNQKTFIYRSSWEHKYMQILEADENVSLFKYESFCINYEYEGNKRRYLPDFFIMYQNGNKEIIEIGQKQMKEEGIDKAKIDAGKRFCEAKGWKFTLLTEDFFGR